ncbi:MAG: SDR family NAD(P)-dependent oxidoreductase [Solirubrobacterales bacterium]|nr:SDR family NAD(P)-dependent oxidoreductase [Solirubrobacterales bacterium]
MSDLDLTGRVAVVTGGGGGLGRSYALALAERGAKVVVNDLGAEVAGAGADSSRAGQVAAEITGLGGTAVAEHSSVATPEGGEAIIQRALDEWGQIDILVNNAGNLALASFAKLDVREIDRILEVHLGGAFYVTQPAYRAMLPRKRGKIIFTASGVASFGNLGASTYGAAKGGVLGLMSVLKMEAARHGIQVNAVAPMAQTRMAEDVSLYDHLSEDAVSPDLVAPVVVYFASDACELTGEVWSVGSGSVNRLFTGRTAGYFKHPDSEGMLTAEDVAGNVETIRDPEGFTTPPSWPAELEMAVERLG